VEIGARVRVHDEEGDDLGIAHVTLPIEIGDEIALQDDPLPFVIVDVVLAPPGAKVPALVKVDRAVLHAV
jgi:hypothetical protein